jgi:2-methylcitrate synthase
MANEARPTTEPTVQKGLEGVVVDVTAISEVVSNQTTSSLLYRGCPAQELAERCRFEEVAHLLLEGDLPNKAQLDAFSQQERRQRAIPQALLPLIKSFPKHAHPMDVVRTGVSYLGAQVANTLHLDLAATRAASVQLLAQIPSIVAATFRSRHDKDFIAPDPKLGFSENFFHMCFGKVPDAETLKALDVSMVLYAEHSFNASTFTARCVTSTTADVYSAITAGIAALKGPLHGGANEEVMYMLKEIADPRQARQWVNDALAQKKKIMGFGHRVYKFGDSRAPTMQKYGLALARKKGETKWHDIAGEVERAMIEAKKIYPNLDYPSAPAYFLMGFDIDLFTPLFVMARITGWCAHVMEQMQANRIIRPLSQYVGPGPREVVPIDRR